jgi:dTDP-4-amino-4,6-dideoxygalactose transaminase
MKQINFHSVQLGRAEERAVVKVLRSGWITKGPETIRFEDDFAAYVQSRFAVGLNSCTAAMHLGLVALGIGPGDEVITTPLTFASTANVIEHVGARVVFADIDLETGTIDPREIEKKISARTRAVIIVHLGGCPCALEEIMSICRKKKVALIEDCAHALGAYYRGQHVGTFGKVGAFSFYATKNLTTGEGGMAITQDERLRRRILSLSLHGLSTDAWKRHQPSGRVYYTVDAAGYKYNMFDIQAAIGIEQLQKQPALDVKRERIWQRYMKRLEDVDLLSVPVVPPLSLHGKHLFSVLIDTGKIRLSRDRLIERLRARGIQTQVHFLSLHLHPYYRRKYAIKKNDLPRAYARSCRALSLPFYPHLSLGDVDYVCDMLCQCLSENKKRK